jgi:hypothetical protein
MGTGAADTTLTHQSKKKNEQTLPNLRYVPMIIISLTLDKI